MIEDAIFYLFVANGRLSSAALGGAIGAMAALSGYIIGKVFFKKQKYASKLALILGILSFSIINSMARGYLQEKFADRYLEKNVEHVISNLERERIFSVIFRYHPESRDEVERRFKEILSTAPDGDVARMSAVAMAPIVDAFFQSHLPAASNEAIHDLVEHELSVLKRFEHMSELCVAYALGRVDLLVGKVPNEVIKEIGDVKANVIESAVQNPSVPPLAASEEEILKILLATYSEKGYDIYDIEKLADIQKLPTEEGCRVYIEWNEVLVGLEMNKLAFVFKNILYMNRE